MQPTSFRIMADNPSQVAGSLHSTQTTGNGVTAESSIVCGPVFMFIDVHVWPDNEENGISSRLEAPHPVGQECSGDADPYRRTKVCHTNGTCISYNTTWRCTLCKLVVYENFPRHPNPRDARQPNSTFRLYSITCKQLTSHKFLFLHWLLHGESTCRTLQRQFGLN